MFLAFKLSDLITVPFGWVLGQLYNLTGNYGISLILFSFIVYMALLPVTAKSKQGTMKMSRLQPRIQDIQKRYASDPNKQNEAMQKLYEEEGLSMYSGCLWSFVPLFVLLPLFTIIRNPMIYILGESEEIVNQIIEIIKGLDPSLFGSNNYYDQVTAASVVAKYAAEIKEAIPAVGEATLAGINFEFLGINIGAVPSFTFWSWEKFDWAHIGLFLIPVLSAGAQFIQSQLMMKLNNSVITNEKGVQDEETANNSQAAQTSKTMMWMMPIMSLWIGFTASAALSIYWFVGGIVRTIQDVILTKHYRKIYDAEDAVRLQRAMEEEAIEAEKERIRAERRAANPEGITANTSKKKLAKAEREKDAAAKAAAAREYALKKGLTVEETEEKEVLSGIPERPFCKGRAYDPNRYQR
ncbi:MAG: YidC/Oxa1 family membrane protein insertase [Oscillospiraceae bacterium]|nr:YidC/Oxa1 family membrane protein insertase [Oscillospiraceae bacterium]